MTVKFTVVNMRKLAATSVPLPPRPHSLRLSCHPPIKLSILREAVDERHEEIVYLHQAMACFIADKSERRISSFGARAAEVLMRGVRFGGLVLMWVNALASL